MKLSLLKQMAVLLANGLSGGVDNPTSGWEVGIPGDASKLMYQSRYSNTKADNSAGAVITVVGEMKVKFDNSSPTMDVTIPVSNGNSISGVSGSVKRRGSTAQSMNVTAAIHGSDALKVGFAGSGMNTGLANEIWDYKYTYTLT